MKKTLIIIAAISAAITAWATDRSKNQLLRFTDLPFSEGKLFVAISYENNNILATSVEVDNDTIALPVDLSKYSGKKLKFQAFQDLNENNTLDFDTYGRPQEPCLQTTITPTAQKQVFDFKLIQY